MERRLRDADKKIIDGLINFDTDVPKHVAIIMDGNGRWAKKRGLPRVAGHHRGVETVREIVETCVHIGIKHLTIYTFSKENWRRPEDEVNTLMRLIVRSLRNETEELHGNNIKVTAKGDLSSLPLSVQDELLATMEKTKNNTQMTLNLALSYSGRWDITEAVKKIAGKVKSGEMDISNITDQIVSENLCFSDTPDPDLLIRSGGENRISNFLLWQIAYSELYITNVLWPNFGFKDLALAIKDYQSRERRFGLVSEQLTRKPKKNHNVTKLSQSA